MTIIILASCQKENEPIDPLSPKKPNRYSVSQKLAKTIAGNISFENETNALDRSMANPENNIAEIFPVVPQESDTVFYIINYIRGGFIILSADQRTIPILAHSPENSFPTDAEYYPPGLVGWLEATNEYIHELRLDNPEQDSEIQDEWDMLTYYDYPGGGGGIVFDSDENNGCKDTYTHVYPLMDTEWDQRCGFNDDMPYLHCGPCGNAWVGCVPLAIGQVMKYHEHPSSYNWSGMPNTYATSVTSAFLRDVFDNIPAWEKSYGCGGTGVDKDYDVANFMKMNFSYFFANNASYYDNSSIVENDIANGRPVILSGGENVGWWIFDAYGNGHMWVTDGYVRGNLCLGYGGTLRTLIHHMRWGWGYYDGYFVCYDFSPGPYTFNYEPEIVYNIQP